MTKIKLITRRDGTSYYADESGKFVNDPFVAGKYEFVRGDFKESDAAARPVAKPVRVKENFTARADAALRDLLGVKDPTEAEQLADRVAQLDRKMTPELKSVIQAYRAMGLTESESIEAADREELLKNVPW